jgi:hypothetical protein
MTKISSIRWTMVGMAAGFWAQVAYGVYQFTYFSFYGKM